MALVVLPALPFGAVGSWSRALVQAGSFAALGLALASVGDRRAARLAGVPVLLLAMVGGWAVIQSLPWPTVVVRGLTPSTAAAWEQAHALLEPTAGDAGGPAFVPLSLSPVASRAASLHWLAAAAALAAAALLGERRATRRLVLTGLVGATVVQVLVGAGLWLDRSTSIWGVEVPGDVGRLRGTFVNPDHFAFFVGLGLTSLGAWMWWSMRRALRARWSSVEERVLGLGLPPLLLLFVVVGLAASGSRAGLVAAGLALAAQGSWLVAVRRERRMTLVGGLLGVALPLLLALVGWRANFRRLLETSAYDLAWNARIAAWRDTLELWRSAPWTGIGVGAFRDAFARVQSPSLPGSWYHAHSDLLETLATAGIVVSTLLVAGVAFVLRGLWRAFTDGRRSEDRATALAAAGATVFALLHAAVEFPLTIPANATALAVVVGLGLTAPRSSERREQRPRVRRTHFLDHDIDSTPRAASGADATRGVRRLDRSHDDLSRGTSRRSRLESTSPRNDAARD